MLVMFISTYCPARRAGSGARCALEVRCRRDACVVGDPAGFDSCSRCHQVKIKILPVVRAVLDTIDKGHGILGIPGKSRQCKFYIRERIYPYGQ